MGTWSVAIFGNDTAADVRDDFRALLEDGRSDEDATSEILAKFREALADRDEAPSVWIGLAAAQYRLGRLHPTVKERALRAIEAGADLHLWEDAKLRKQRRAVLLGLRAELLGPARKRAAVRRPRPKSSPVEKGQVLMLPVDNSRQAKLRVIGIEQTRQGDWPIVDFLDGRGRVYEIYEQLIEWEWKRAQFVLLSPRWKDLPARGDFEVVGTDQAAAPVDPNRSYLSWATLRIHLAALIDDPQRLRVRK